MQFGYTCSAEEFEASEMVEFAVAAEAQGFEFVTVSDHFHPWTQAQGHSPFAWSTVAAIACTSANKELVDAFRAAGGTGRVIGQLTLCWNSDVEQARTIAHRQWPNAALEGQLSQDLPTWTHFEDATALATIDDVAAKVICGDDVGAVVEAVTAYAEAGFTDLHFHQIGPDQLGFIDWWDSSLRDAVTSVDASTRSHA